MILQDGDVLVADVLDDTRNSYSRFLVDGDLVEVTNVIDHYGMPDSARLYVPSVDTFFYVLTDRTLSMARSSGVEFVRLI